MTFFSLYNFCPVLRFFIYFSLSIGSIFLIFIVVGCVFMLLGLQEIWRSHRSQHWQEIPATILAVKLKETDVSRPSRYPQICDRKYYKMIVFYTYIVNGKLYRNRQSFWADTGVDSSRQAFEKRQEIYQPSRELIAYYHPNHPQKSTLEREIHNNTKELLILGAVAIAIGLIMGSIIIPSAMNTCGITVSSTQPRDGAPAWCQQGMLR